MTFLYFLKAMTKLQIIIFNNEIKTKPGLSITDTVLRTRLSKKNKIKIR